MVAYRARDADAAGFGQCLQPCRDIDAVAVNVVAVGDDVAEIDPDAERDALVFGRLSALRSTIARWISTAQRTASTTLENSTSIPSPVVLTMRP